MSRSPEQIRSFTLASTENEETKHFLERLAQEIAEVEIGGGKLLNVAMQLPDAPTQNDSYEATIYYAHDAEKDYKMRVMEVREVIQDQTTGLHSIFSKLDSWLAAQKEFIVHDVQLKFLTDQQNADDVLVARIFFSLNSDD